MVDNNIGSYTRLKILTIGESAVGKTALLLRYTDGRFSNKHIMTIGVDYKTKMYTSSKGQLIKLQVWDTAGQEKFRTITKQYYKDSDGILLVYDITDKESFKRIEEWLKQIRENCKRDNIVIILIGNKSDLVNERQVSFEEGKELADANSIDFLEASAKDNQNVNEAFNLVSEKAILVKNITLDNKGGVNLSKKVKDDDDKRGNASSNCCGKK